MASRLGLECVSIGELAKAAGMSKSGLFAHFRSKERLQVEILDHAAREFTRSVIVPALKKRGGVPRIKALVRNWVRWADNLRGGCIFVMASAEYTDRPGKVRDRLLEQQREWIDCLRRIGESAIKSGDFRKGTDCEQFAFELYSLLLGFHLYKELLESSDIAKRQAVALDRLIGGYQ